MKIKKGWFLWLSIFVCFLILWAGRSAMIEYRLHTKHLKIDIEHVPAPAPDADTSEKSKSSPPLPPPPLKEPVDIWSWIIKICAGLSGVKTLLEIVDKFKPKRVKQ